MQKPERPLGAEGFASWQPAGKWDHRPFTARNWILPSATMSLKAESSPEPPISAQPLDALRLVLRDLGQRIQWRLAVPRFLTHRCCEIVNRSCCKLLNQCWCILRQKKIKAKSNFLQSLALPGLNATFNFCHCPLVALGSFPSSFWELPSDSSQKSLDPPLPYQGCLHFLFLLALCSHCCHHTSAWSTFVHPKYPILPSQEGISLCLI